MKYHLKVYLGDVLKSEKSYNSVGSAFAAAKDALDNGFNIRISYF